VVQSADEPVDLLLEHRDERRGNGQAAEHNEPHGRADVGVARRDLDDGHRPSADDRDDSHPPREEVGGEQRRPQVVDELGEDGVDPAVLVAEQSLDADQADAQRVDADHQRQRHPAAKPKRDHAEKQRRQRVGEHHPGLDVRARGHRQTDEPQDGGSDEHPAAHDPIAGSWWGNRILVPPFTVSL
jgi:hypothetical protein